MKLFIIFVLVILGVGILGYMVSGTHDWVTSFEPFAKIKIHIAWCGLILAVIGLAVVFLFRHLEDD